MKITHTKITGTTRNGSAISGECVMLDRDGNMYECIDNKYHPNPGTEDTGYDEIERTVDWLYSNNIRSIRSALDEWINIRMSDVLSADPSLSFEDAVIDVMYSDLYTPGSQTMRALRKAYDAFMSEDTSNSSSNESELDVCRKIVNHLNENFLRVRAGGKLNPQGANAIYFRISSHGYNWHHVIEDFLWDVFGSPDKMPKLIWIGHDAETNPPETTLFEGTPQELIEQFDSKVFASYELM